MSAEHRYYSLEKFSCPLCFCRLVWASRTAQPDSMKLVHRKSQCSRSGEAYYAPGVDLTPMPKEFQ